MDYISEKISRDPVTGKLYVGKKPGDDQAPDTTASGTPQPEKKGANFSLGGVEPTTGKGFLGVQPGRDPADTFSGKLANLFIPRMDKETGRLYMGTQVGRDPKPKADTAAATTTSVGTPAAGTPSQDANDKTASPKVSSFGSAFKAAREARLSGKGGDTFEFGGKKYHSYQAGEKRPGAGAASAAKPAAASAAASAEPAAEPAAVVGKMGTEKLPTSASFEDRFKAATPYLDGARKLTDRFRLADTKVSTIATKTPGAEKASDEAKDKADADAKVAAALAGARVAAGKRKSTGESIEHYKEAFRAVLAEASDQKFTDYDIERQVSHGLGQQYDKNNPEHKKKADALRKYHQAKGRYLLYPESINQSASRTDQAAREQAARNSQSAQSQSRYRGFGYSAERTAGGGGSRGGGSRGGSTPGGFTSNLKTGLRYGKTGLRYSAALGPGLAGAWLGSKLGVAAAAALTPKDYNSKTDYPSSLPQYKSDGVTEVDKNYNADIAKVRGEYGRSATIKGSETAGGFALGTYAMDKTAQLLGQPKPVPKPGLLGKAPTLTKSLGRGAVSGVGFGLGDYITNKTANTPYKDAGGLAGDVLKGASVGYGMIGKPGAIIGGTAGLLKSATRMAGDDYKSASDESRARQRSRGIARFGFNPYERLDAEVEAEKKKQAVLKPKIDLPPGYGVLKREYQKKPQ